MVAVLSHHRRQNVVSCVLSVPLHHIVNSMRPRPVLLTAVPPVPGSRKGSPSAGEYFTHSGHKRELCGDTGLHLAFLVECYVPHVVLSQQVRIGFAF